MRIEFDEVTATVRSPEAEPVQEARDDRETKMEPEDAPLAEVRRVRAEIARQRRRAARLSAD